MSRCSASTSNSKFRSISVGGIGVALREEERITRALDLANGDVRKVKRFSRLAKLKTLLRYDDNRRDEAGAIAQAPGRGLGVESG